MAIAAGQGLRLRLGSAQDMERSAAADEALFVFRSPSAAVQARAATVDARLSVDLNAAVAASAGQTLVVADAAFDVVDGAVFELTASVPAGFSVVEEALVTDAGKTQVYSEEISGDDRRLTWKPRKPLLAGEHGQLVLQLSRTQEGPAREETWDLPRIRIQGTERLRGIYAIACDPAYRVHVARSEWARPISYEALLADGKVPPGTQAVLSLEAPEYAAHIELVQQSAVTWVFAEVSVDVQRDLATETTKLVYNIENGPARELRFSLPVRAGIRRHITVSEPTTRLEIEAVREGREYYVAELSEPLLGGVTVTIAVEHELDAQGGRLVIDPPRSEETMREGGEVAVSSEGALEVICTAQGLHREEMPHGEQIFAGGRRLIERYYYTGHPWGLVVEARRHPQAEVLGMLADRIDSTFLVDASGELIADETITLRSRGHQTVALKLPEGSKLWAVLVNDKPAQARSSGNLVEVSLSRTRSDWGINRIRVVHRPAPSSHRAFARMEIAPVALDDGVPVGLTEAAVYVGDGAELAWSDADLAGSAGRALAARGALMALKKLTVPLGVESVAARLALCLFVGVIVGLYLLFRRTKSAMGAFGTTAVVVVLLVLLVGLLLPALGRAREEARSTQSRSNLRQIGLAMTMYGQDNKGMGPQGLGLLFSGGYLTQKGGSVLWNPNSSGEQQGPESNYILRQEVADGTLSLIEAGGEAIAWEDPTDPVVRERNSINALFADGSVKTFSGLSQLRQPHPDAVQWPELLDVLNSLYAQDGGAPGFGLGDEGIAAGEAYSGIAPPVGGMGGGGGGLGSHGNGRADLPERPLEARPASPSLGEQFELEQRKDERRRRAGRRLVVLRDKTVMVETDAGLVPLGQADEDLYARLVPEEGKLSMPLVLERVGRRYVAKAPGGVDRMGLLIAPSSVVSAGGYLVLLAVLAMGLACWTRGVWARIGVVLLWLGLTHGAYALWGEVFAPAANGAFAAALILAVLHLGGWAGRGRWRRAPLPAWTARVLLILAFTVSLLAVSGRAIAQEDAGTARADDPVAALIDRLSPPGPVTLRDDTVYVPYRLAPSGRPAPLDRCYLTEQLYLALSNRARELSRGEESPWLYTQAQYTATVREGRVHVSGELQLVTYAPMLAVPVAFRGVSIEEVTIEGPPGSSGSLSPEGALIADLPGEYSVRFAGVADASVRPEAGRLELNLPSVAAGSLALTLPPGSGAGAEVDVDVGPGVRAYEMSSSAEGTKIQLATGGGGRLWITWRTRVQVAREERFMTAAVHGLAFAGTSAVTTLSRADVALRVGSSDRLAFALPGDATVMSVDAAELRGWRVVREDDLQTLELFFNNEWTGSKRVFIAASRHRTSADEEIDAARDVPRLRGVARWTGTFAVAVLPGAQGSVVSTKDAAFATRAEAVALAPDAWGRFAQDGYEQWLMGQLADSKLHAFSVAGENPSIRLALAEVKRRLTADAQTDVTVARDVIHVRAALRAVADAPLFRLVVSVPAGLRLDEVKGDRIRRWELDPDANTLTVYPDGAPKDLSVEVLGRILAPGDGSLPLPVVASPEADKGRTTVRVRAETGVEVVVEDTAGFSHAAAARGAEPEEWLSVLTSSARDVAGRMRVKRLEPSVSVETWIALALEEGYYAFDARMTFNVERAPVDRVRFSVPERLAAMGISITGPIRETVRSASAGRVIYELVLERPTVGAFTIAASAADALDAETFVVPELAVHDVDRTRTHVAIVNRAAAHVVAAGSAGLTPVEGDREQRVPDWIDARSLALLYEADGPWNLSLALERYVKEKGLEIFVDRAEFRTAIDGNRAVTHAGYEVYNRYSQMMNVVLPEGASLWGVSVAGHPVEVAKGPDGRSFGIALLKVAGEKERFRVDLLYAMDLTESEALRLEPPALEGLTVSRTDWRLELPEQLRARVRTNMRFEGRRGNPPVPPTEAYVPAPTEPKVSSFQKGYRSAGKKEAKQAVMDQSDFVYWFQERSLNQQEEQQAVIPQSQRPPAEAPTRQETAPEVNDVTYILQAVKVPDNVVRLYYTITGETPWLRFTVRERTHWRGLVLGLIGILLAASGLYLVFTRPRTLLAPAWDRLARLWWLWACLAVVSVAFTALLPLLLFTVAAIAGRRRQS